MIATALNIASLIMAAALTLNLYRLLRGPDLVDRLLALDTMNVNTIILMLLIGISEKSDLYFEAAMLIALIGFVGTVAVTKFLLRGDIIE